MLNAAGSIVKGVTLVVLTGVLAVAWAVPAWSLPSPGTPAPAAISDLESDGYQVIVNKVGNGPLDKCDLTAVRKGHDIKGSWLQRLPGKVGSRSIYKTVYVDLMCAA